MTTVRIEGPLDPSVMFDLIGREQGSFQGGKAYQTRHGFTVRWEPVRGTERRDAEAAADAIMRLVIEYGDNMAATMVARALYDVGKARFKHWRVNGRRVKVEEEAILEVLRDGQSGESQQE